MAETPYRPVRLYQQVAEKLATAIASGQYPVGTRLPAERDLAAAHAVSRPTIREALLALEIDGLVDVRMGSGVYVLPPPGGEAIPAIRDVGPFELTEARLLMEGEAAALAATLITAEEIHTLERLLEAMDTANHGGNAAGHSEAVDREFHNAIANATHNSAISAVVDSLWSMRERSPQCVRAFQKSRSKGVLPVVDEHRLILEALRARDPVAARAAMHSHLKRVLNYLLDATEIETLEEARAKMAAQRNRFAIGEQLSRR